MKKFFSFIFLFSLLMVAIMPVQAAPVNDEPLPDFNNDHYADLVIGVPNEAIGLNEDAGAVHVLPGSASGPTATDSQLWYQGNNGLGNSADAQDHFGEALAIGDFDGNGYYDLAVGIPYEDIGTITNAGALHIIYGTASGLDPAGNEIFYEGINGIPGTPETSDYFAKSLASGDFNNDGFDDLAVGVPYDAVDSINDTGFVQVIYGTSGGLSGLDDQVWSQNSGGILGNAEVNDNFGYSLSTGDFNGDGFSDLAIGAFGEDVDANNSGAVNVIYGSQGGLASTGNQLWYQGYNGLLETPENDDAFGISLAAGDFNGDSRDDLVVGVPYEGVSTKTEAGLFHVIYGAEGGLTATNNQIVTQDSYGVLDSAENGDQMGRSFAAGDFNGDGRDDLAVGVPNEDLETYAATNSGYVNVFYGSQDGLDYLLNQQWHQNITSVQEEVGANEFFGYSLAAGDFNNDGCADLAIGVPMETIGSPDVAAAGVVHIIFGSPNRLTSTGNQLWSQDSAGIGGGAEALDRFGTALAALPRVFYKNFLPYVEKP